MEIGENFQNLIEKYLYATDDEKTVSKTLLEFGQKSKNKNNGF